MTLVDASYTYRALPVIAGLDWTWHQGEQWACLAPNGAGKTSLARILTQRGAQVGGSVQRHPHVAEAGTAYVCFEQQKALVERDRKLDDADQRENAFDPGTTVRTAILGGRDADNTFEEWTQRLRMQHILDRGLRFISTGEMRKTLLVKALLSDPALLILDSPFDGLDRASQHELAGILEHLLASPLPILLLCRQLEDIPYGVTHAVVLHDGNVLRCADKSTVLAQDDVQALMRPPALPLGALPPVLERPYTLEPELPLLVLKDVAVAYGDTQVLHGLDWTFEPGQHCFVAGPNGCGKTTLLSLVTGDNHKAYGQDITLFGRRRGSGESVWDIKQKYGQVDTALHLNHARGMKVIEVVVSGFFDTVGLYDDWGEAQRSVAEQWLEALGIGELAREGFDGLSFGMQRMVLLARAMVKSPAILILDEPCLGLDGAHRQRVLRAVDHIAANSDTQVIYVSHSAGESPTCINQWLTFVPTDTHYAVEITPLG